MSFEIAKAGWVYRRTSILKRWKRHWFVLYTDGTLRYFESPNTTAAEGAYVLPAKCVLIKTGWQVRNVKAPQGHNVEFLLMLVFVGNQTLTMCAESLEDMRAWQMSLEQARLLNRTGSAAPPPLPPPPLYAVAPPPYPTQNVAVVPGYAGQMYYGSHPPPYVVQQPGTTIIYATDYPHYYHRRGYDGTDVALGVMAGAAFGSLMWGPLLWW